MTDTDAHRLQLVVITKIRAEPFEMSSDKRVRVVAHEVAVDPPPDRRPVNPGLVCHGDEWLALGNCQHRGEASIHPRQGRRGHRARQMTAIGSRECVTFLAMLGRCAGTDI